MLNRMELKKAAKAITKSAQVSAYSVALVYLVIRWLLNAADNFMQASEDTVIYIGGSAIYPYREVFYSHAPFPTATVVFVSVLVWLLSSVLSAGWVLYHQGVRQGRVMPISTLFEGFAFAGKIILLDLITTLFMTLWSLLFVIPGIIAGYRYRFALYNLCENPEMGVMDAIRLSKQQTQGHKMDLFVLDLSFIGWSLLCALTLGILSIWISPYIQQTDLGYFEAIKAEKGMGGLFGQDPMDDTFHPDDRF